MTIHGHLPALYTQLAASASQVETAAKESAELRLMRDHRNTRHGLLYLHKARNTRD